MSLNELFQSHPDTLTDKDIDRMVKELRDNRHSFKIAKQLKTKGANTIAGGSLDDILSSIGLEKGKLPLGGKK